MKLRVFRQIVELNQTFERLTASVLKLEAVAFFLQRFVRQARSDVEIPRICANRELFDNVQEVVEDDARWAYRFQRNFAEKLKYRDDTYLEFKTFGERWKRKGLLPRVVIVLGWDISDEDRHNEVRATRKPRAGVEKSKASNQIIPTRNAEKGDRS